MVLVWNAPGGASNQTQPRLVELAARLWREHGPEAGGGSGLVHSVWANFQVLRTGRCARACALQILQRHREDSSASWVSTVDCSHVM